LISVVAFMHDRQLRSTLFLCSRIVVVGHRAMTDCVVQLRALPSAISGMILFSILACFIVGVACFVPVYPNAMLAFGHAYGRCRKTSYRFVAVLQSSVRV
jgi:hypothetical protein